jgi:20S proteasome alpha/beta subunit
MHETLNQLVLKGTAIVEAVSRDGAALVSDTRATTGSLELHKVEEKVYNAMARSEDISPREMLRMAAQTTNSAMKRGVVKEEGFDVSVIEGIYSHELGADGRERF